MGFLLRNWHLKLSAVLLAVTLLVYLALRRVFRSDLQWS